MVYFTGDIALVRLDSHADISKYTPACLPTDGQSFFRKFAVITGFWINPLLGGEKIRKRNLFSNITCNLSERIILEGKILLNNI